jgi:SdpC family antimicrobial peptide
MQAVTCKENRVIAKTRTLIVFAITAAILCPATPSIAAPDPVAPRGTPTLHSLDDPGRATLTTSLIPTHYTYQDMDVLQFLVLSEGAIAEDHPKLAAQLGFVSPPPETDRAATRQLMLDYLDAHPDFHERVATRVQSGDPVRVDRALERFASSFNDFLTQRHGVEQKANSASARGFAVNATFIATAGWVAAVAGVVVYAGVAGFHVGVAVTVIVYVYLPGMEGAPKGIERDAIVQMVSSTLS